MNVNNEICREGSERLGGQHLHRRSIGRDLSFLRDIIFIKRSLEKLKISQPTTINEEKRDSELKPRAKLWPAPIITTIHAGCLYLRIKSLESTLVF